MSDKEKQKVIDCFEQIYHCLLNMSCPDNPQLGRIRKTIEELKNA